MEMKLIRYANDEDEDGNIEMNCLRCRLILFSHCDFDTVEFIGKQNQFMKDHKNGEACRNTALNIAN